MVVIVNGIIANLGSYYGDHDKPIAHFPFNFNLLSIRPDHNAEDLKNIIEYWYDNMPEGKWASSLVSTNFETTVIILFCELKLIFLRVVYN